MPSCSLFFNSIWNTTIIISHDAEKMKAMWSKKIVNFLTNCDNYEQIRANKLNRRFVKQGRKVHVTSVLENSIACVMRTACVAILGRQARLTERAKTRKSAVHSAAWCSHIACWLPYLEMHCATDWQIQYKYHTPLTILDSVSARWWGCFCGVLPY